MSDPTRGVLWQLIYDLRAKGIISEADAMDWLGELQEVKHDE